MLREVKPDRRELRAAPPPERPRHVAVHARRDEHGEEKVQAQGRNRMTGEELMQAASDPTAGTGASGDGAEGTARVEGLLARIEDCEDDAPDRGDQTRTPWHVSFHHYMAP